MDSVTKCCTVDGCLNEAKALGLCNKHYLRKWKHGDVTKVIRQKSFMERFLESFDRDGENQCWNWNKSVTSAGYGLITDETGKQIGSNRASWILHNGPIPKGMVICHKCDNRLCVNPSHLFVGTQRDNVRDCINKGRRNDVRGEMRPNARLTQAAVRFIRRTHRPVVELARCYGVSVPTIRDVKSHRYWRHVV